MKVTELHKNLNIYRVSQKSLPLKFFEYLHFFIWQYQLFFIQIIGKCNKFLFIEKNLKNIVQKYHLELIYKNLIFSVFPEKHYVTFLF